ncbi:hypothetical protein AAY473_023568 [Plecturocebus cupreus]
MRQFFQWIDFKRKSTGQESPMQKDKFMPAFMKEKGQVLTPTTKKLSLLVQVTFQVLDGSGLGLVIPRKFEPVSHPSPTCMQVCQVPLADITPIKGTEFRDLTFLCKQKMLLQHL